jgi:hypothetical protein
MPYDGKSLQRQTGALIKTLMRQYQLSKASVYPYLERSTDAYKATERAAAD